MKHLLVTLNELGVRLSLEGDDLRIAAPQGVLTAELRQALREQKGAILEALKAKRNENHEALPAIVADPAGLNLPFALSDLQHAYWLGRIAGIELSQVATHGYSEFEGRRLDMARLNETLRMLIDHHPMLRAVVDGDGLQHILPEVPRYTIAVTDCSHASAAEAEAALQATRAALSHQVFAPERWPLFEIRVTCLPGERQRLHFSRDMLVFDGQSSTVFLRDWMRLYAKPGSAPAALGLSYRDYRVAEQKLREGERYRRSQAWWMARIDELPPAPQLPVAASLQAQQARRFTHRTAQLDAARWAPLKTQARNLGITPTSLVMAAYAELLARWSASAHFTLNLTLGARLPMHKDVNALIGNFTTLQLQEVDRRDASQSFAEFAQALQKRFMTDYDHRLVCGVTVLREWGKRRGAHAQGMTQATMPVVFTSGLAEHGDAGTEDMALLGPQVYSASQTSQLWLDHVALEEQGALRLDWYSADEVFEPGVVDAMFAAYVALIHRLADDASQLRGTPALPLPASMQARRDAANRSAAPLPELHLHAALVEHAQRRPESVALITAARNMSYAELLGESCAVADALLRKGLQPGQPVAVMMRKGWEQVVAVCGVLLAGGAFMPVDTDLPLQRRQELLRLAEVRQVLVQAGAAASELADGGEWLLHQVQPGQQAALGAKHLRSLAGELTQLAYLMFTSGSTGTPKAVMIDHRAAMNTVSHVNRLIGLGAADRVLGVSALSFDLSVYDIFGPLSIGASIVLPEADRARDAGHWRALMRQHRVSVWNSAPQLMQMLMDAEIDGDTEADGPLPLRAVLLSGDFIPVDLPARIRTQAPQARVIALGGATEAAIWSNYHVVDANAAGTAPIPYGKPLPNQTLWVLDERMRSCPDHVSGRIFIGGVGLAQGYWRDQATTDARFIQHPKTGERLYDTGDIGRYAADGNVMICGRADGQVKIRGHRIELGEIEAVLDRHPEVRKAVVLAIGQPARRELAAHVEWVSPGCGEREARGLKAYLEARLPGYMVPRQILCRERMPLSPNGKIDRQALAALSAAEAGTRRMGMPPRNGLEQRIHEAWMRVLPGAQAGINDNFFELGGDSLLLTQLLRELNAAMPSRVTIAQLYEHQSIEAQAGMYSRRVDGAVARREAVSTEVVEMELELA